MCGNRIKAFITERGCGVMRFVGVEDVALNQGIGIDLEEGVTAYDGNGNEIEYTVTPDSIDKCDVGEHEVIYRAWGEGKKSLPSFCMGKRKLYYADGLCHDKLLQKKRLVTILQIDPPRIDGLDTVRIAPNTEFDPAEGVTATDGNGNDIEFSYSGTVDTTVSGAIASFVTDFEQNAKSVKVTLEPIQSGSGTPSPSNVRPIYGHTVCLYDRTQKNLLDKSIGIFSANRSIFGGSLNTVDGSLVLNAGIYTFSVSEVQDTLYVDDALNRIASASNATEVSFTLTKRTEIKLTANKSVGDSSVMESYDYQLEVGSVASSYEPYQGTSYTTNLGRTVYGGTVDLVSGVMTVDRAIAYLNDCAISEGSGSYFWYTTNSGLDIPRIKDTNAKLISDRLVAIPNTTQTSAEGVISFYDNGIIRWKEHGEMSLEEYKTYIASNPPTICYELAQPQTYQLTPTEVELLKGTNNVWSDCGDTEVVYEEEMPSSGSVEYLTVGERVIKYTATDECGNTTEAQRTVLVGITAQACVSQACGSFAYCGSSLTCEATTCYSITSCEALTCFSKTGCEE